MIITAHRQLYNKAFKTVWIIYSVCGALIVVAAVLLPSQTILQNTPTCYSVKQFGKQCFMCGSTRSFIQAGQGNFKQAANFNRLALVLFFTAITNTFIFVYYLITNNFKNTKQMKLASLILGIITIVGMFIGFIPCLGWFNWLNLPLALVGIILGALDYNSYNNLNTTKEYDPTYIQRKPFPTGLLLCGIAFAFGLLRLIAGGGIF